MKSLVREAGNFIRGAFNCCPSQPQAHPHPSPNKALETLVQKTKERAVPSATPQTSVNYSSRLGNIVTFPSGGRSGDEWDQKHLRISGLVYFLSPAVPNPLSLRSRKDKRVFYTYGDATGISLFSASLEKLYRIY